MFVGHVRRRARSHLLSGLVAQLADQLLERLLGDLLHEGEVVDQQRRGVAAGGEAGHLRQREVTVLRRLARADTEDLRAAGEELLGSHRPTGDRIADADLMAPDRPQPVHRVERCHLPDPRGRDVQPGGHVCHRRLGDPSQLVLREVQRREQRGLPPLGRVLGDRPFQPRVEPALLLRIERTLRRARLANGKRDHCGADVYGVRVRVSREGYRRGMHRILRLWFGLTEPASRGTYLFHGALLMGIKYSADNALVHAVTGVRWTPWDFQPVLLAGLSLPDTRARAFKSNS